MINPRAATAMALFRPSTLLALRRVQSVPSALYHKNVSYKKRTFQKQFFSVEMSSSMIIKI